MQKHIGSMNSYVEITTECSCRETKHLYGGFEGYSVSGDIWHSAVLGIPHGQGEEKVCEVCLRLELKAAVPAPGKFRALF